MSSALFVLMCSIPCKFRILVFYSSQVKVKVMCVGGPRELVFKSAQTCSCFHCKKYWVAPEILNNTQQCTVRQLFLCTTNNTPFNHTEFFTRLSWKVDIKIEEKYTLSGKTERFIHDCITEGTCIHMKTFMHPQVLSFQTQGINGRAL